MRLRDRIGLLIRSQVGWLLRRDQDRAEATLRRADKTEALLAQMEAHLERISARQSVLQGQLQQAQAMAHQWQTRADDALRAGDESAARAALRQKVAYTRTAETLQASLDRHGAAARELTADLDRLETRLAQGRPQVEHPRPQVTPAPAPEIKTATTEAAETAEALESLETIQERMSRVWSDAQIEQELDAMKARLSAGNRPGND
ncbi:MAG: PspA/IM30 family protein [Chloroflexota bacterium]